MAKSEKNYDIQEEASSAGRIMPFEFLYLISNAKPRMEILKDLKPPKNIVTKVKLSEFLEGEERRPDLEQVYPFDRAGNGTRHNPREQLFGLHTDEAKDCRIKIYDMRNMFKELKQKGYLSELERDTIAL